MFAIRSWDGPLDRLRVFKHRSGMSVKIDAQQSPFSRVGKRPDPQALTVGCEVEAGEPGPVFDRYRALETIFQRIEVETSFADLAGGKIDVKDSEL